MGVQLEAWLVFKIFSYYKFPFRNFYRYFGNELSTWKYVGHLGDTEMAI
jgi:hypothetical protein